MECRSHETREFVYEFCKEFFQKNLYFPTVREICDGVGLSSTSTVFFHLAALEQEGKIRRASDKDALKVPYVIVGAKVIYE